MTYVVYLSKMSQKKILIILAVYLSITGPAYAYLDPGTGSVLLQVIIATLAGALTMITNFWKRLKALCLKLLPSRKKRIINRD